MARNKISQARAKALLDIVERITCRPCENTGPEGSTCGNQGRAPCLPCQARKLLDGVEGVTC